MHITKLFAITDMNCASCVNHIERDVSELKGVHHIRVNFANEKAEVMFDPDMISEDKIIQQIKKTGYTAKLLTQDHESHGHLTHHMNDGVMMSGEDHTTHLSAENDSEIRSKRNKVIFGGALSILIITLTFFVDLPFESFAMMGASFLILAYTGKEFYIKGIPSFLLRGRPNMDTLVALGVSAAFLYSSYLVVVEASHEDFFLDAAIISTFIMLGRFLEAKAKGKASEAIKKLLELSAKFAHKIEKSGNVVDVALEQIQKGDMLLVKPGEKIPTDGIILEGEGVIDESMVTGESIPVDKKEGDHVIGGTLNATTSFSIRTEKVGKETMLSQMIRLVEEAQMSKAPLQKLVDHVSEYFVWAVIGISIITFFSWYVFDPELSHAIIFTVAVLIIACPCALGLATPISLVVGSGKGAELGILIKNAEALEKVHKITTIIFDKTGTITTGHPEVKYFKNLTPETDILSLAASLESKSEHPLAKSIMTYAAQKKTSLIPVKNFKSITGKGVQGSMKNAMYYFGSAVFVSKNLREKKGIQKIIEKLRNEGKTPLLFWNEEKILGIFGIQDSVKTNSKQAIELLKKKNILTVMMTGDHNSVAQAIAEEVGIKEVMAEISPEGKLKTIQNHQKNGEFVAMVGDGINDSPALAKADIGIAMGTGTDIAIESGDIVLVKGDLMKAVEAIELSEATLRNIKQNLFWAFIYNVIGIPIAALGYLNPIFSAFAMAFSSISVVLNALRLKRFRVKA